MHLSLWFVTKFMTASAAAVNASVREEKKNTSPGPALFRSGKQSPRRRKRSQRMPYSALFPGPRPRAGRLYKVAGAASRSSAAGGQTRAGKRAASPGPKTCCPPRRGRGRREPRGPDRAEAGRALAGPRRPRKGRGAWEGRGRPPLGCG